MSASKLKRNTLEASIEKYFVEQVEMYGGMAEKFVSPGRRGVPDRIVTWPCYGFARVHFVELKAPLGALDDVQKRDHARRRKMNCHVFVLWTKTQIDEYVQRFKLYEQLYVGGLPIQWDRTEQ